MSGGRVLTFQEKLRNSLSRGSEGQGSIEEWSALQVEGRRGQGSRPIR